jgi:hypothetical protein
VGLHGPRHCSSRIVAHKVIEIDRAGTHAPEEISKLAAKQLGIP